jgi:general stress protein CsbA
MLSLRGMVVVIAFIFPCLLLVDVDKQTWSLADPMLGIFITVAMTTFTLAAGVGEVHKALSGRSCLIGVIFTAVTSDIDVTVVVAIAITTGAWRKGRPEKVGVRSPLVQTTFKRALLRRPSKDTGREAVTEGAQTIPQTALFTKEKKKKKQGMLGQTIKHVVLKLTMMTVGEGGVGREYIGTSINRGSCIELMSTG